MNAVLTAEKPMTVAEAEECAQMIGEGLETAGANLYEATCRMKELRDRFGWRALGYTSWTECCKKRFAKSRSYVSRLLKAQEVQEALPVGTKEDIPERTLRPLYGETPDVQRDVYQKASEKAGGTPSPAQVASMLAEVNAGISSRTRLKNAIEEEERELLEREARIHRQRAHELLDKKESLAEQIIRGLQNQECRIRKLRRGVSKTNTELAVTPADEKRLRKLVRKAIANMDKALASITEMRSIL